jgi:hypothetical protein
MVNRKPEAPGKPEGAGHRSGRLLTIALDSTEIPAVWRPVTGWTADDDERAYYIEQTEWMR